MTHSQDQSRWKTSRRMARLIFLCAVMGSFIFLRRWKGQDVRGGRRVPTNLTTEQVELGRFVKTVRVDGEVRTFEPAIVYNDCRYWPRNIIELAPEGSYVEEGDILCVLDTYELKERLNEQLLQMIRANAGLMRAEAMESRQLAHNDRRISTNTMLANVAQDKWTAFDLAEEKQKLEELRTEVQMQSERLAMAREQFLRTEDLTAQGFSNPAELEIRKIELQSAHRSVNIAAGLLNLATTYQHPKIQMQLRSEADFAEKERDRTALQNELASTIQQVKTLEMQQMISGVRGHVDYLRKAIANCTIRAPKSGELHYCHKRDEGKFVEVGTLAHYTQEMFWITNRERLIVAGRSSATRVFELEEGQSVEIQIPTLPGQKFSGRLNWIASIPSPPAWFAPYDLFHNVQIDVDGDDKFLERISLGASAQCEVVTDDRENVLQVSVKGVFRHRGDYVALVHDSQRALVRRVLRLGKSNDVSVEVVSGLAEGEHVVIDEKPVLRELADSVMRLLP